MSLFLFLFLRLLMMWTGLDIGHFLKQEIQGPTKFSCKSGSGYKFEEPAINDLIDQIFGDAYITLTCEGESACIIRRFLDML